MDKIVIKIQGVSPHLQGLKCRWCMESVVREVAIGEVIRVPFCGGEDCKEKAINHSEEIYKSLKKRRCNKKRFLERIWFFVTDTAKQKLPV